MLQKFLSDYDLVWVGDDDTRDTAECEQAHSSDGDLRLRGSRFPANVPYHLEY